jgi:hypothetical protein
VQDGERGRGREDNSASQSLLAKPCNASGTELEGKILLDRLAALSASKEDRARPGFFERRERNHSNVESELSPGRLISGPPRPSDITSTSWVYADDGRTEPRVKKPLEFPPWPSPSQWRRITSPSMLDYAAIRHPELAMDHVSASNVLNH